jgi:hypothetical protein
LGKKAPPKREPKNKTNNKQTFCRAHQEGAAVGAGGVGVVAVLAVLVDVAVLEEPHRALRHFKVRVLKRRRQATCSHSPRSLQSSALPLKRKRRRKRRGRGGGATLPSWCPAPPSVSGATCVRWMCVCVRAYAALHGRSEHGFTVGSPPPFFSKKSLLPSIRRPPFRASVPYPFGVVAAVLLLSGDRSNDVTSLQLRSSKVWTVAKGLISVI